MTDRSSARPWMKVLAATSAAFALTLAGCSSSPQQSPAETGAASDELIPLTIQVPPVAPTAPLWLGVEQGFFEEEGLDVEVGPDFGAGTPVEAVVGGQAQMGFAAVSVALQPFSQGLGIQLVAVSNLMEPQTFEVLVKEDSPITGLADLVGTKMAQTSPNNPCTWILKAALEAEGLDPDGIEFTVVSPPEHGLVLDTGQVDSVCITDPFRTVMLSTLGARAVWDAYEDGPAVYQGAPTGSYFVSSEFAKTNPEVVEAFQRALAKSSAWANEHPEEVLDSLPRLFNVDPAIVDSLPVADFVEDIGASSFGDAIKTQIADPMFEYGLVPAKIELDGFIWEP